MRFPIARNKVIALKKIILFLVFIGIVLMVGGCEPSLEYSEFSDRHISETENQLSMPETEYYIYFYGTNCKYCAKIKQEALSLIAALQNDVVYFVVADALSDVQEGVGITKTPSLVKIVSGTVRERYETSADVLTALQSLD
jgi:thioredoxin-related protein